MYIGYKLISFIHSPHRSLFSFVIVCIIFANNNKSGEKVVYWYSELKTSLTLAEINLNRISAIKSFFCEKLEILMPGKFIELVG